MHEGSCHEPDTRIKDPGVVMTFPPFVMSPQEV